MKGLKFVAGKRKGAVELGKFELVRINSVNVAVVTSRRIMLQISNLQLFAIKNLHPVGTGRCNDVALPTKRHDHMTS